MGFKVFYDGMVMFYVHLHLDYHTFFYFKKKCRFGTLLFIVSLQMRDIIPPNAPSQEVGHWSAIILHTARVFIAPLLVFHLKSMV